MLTAHVRVTIVPVKPGSILQAVHAEAQIVENGVAQGIVCVLVAAFTRVPTAHWSINPDSHAGNLIYPVGASSTAKPNLHHAVVAALTLLSEVGTVGP